MDTIFSSNQRIIILQGLQRDAGHSLSNEMLQRLLRDHGHSLGVADVNEQVNWLEQRGYVKTRRLGKEGLVIATITRPGLEVAEGYVKAEGIDSPMEE
jgi:Fe2+ or Zn2+ uptake regulation protein